MPTPTYDLIASNVLSSSAASVSFSSIPATYRDLVLVTTGRNISWELYINGDTGANYSRVYMRGTGTSEQTGAGTENFVRVNQWEAIIQFMDYSATDKHKTILMRSNTYYQATQADAQRWANTAAITSLELNAGSGNTFPSGTQTYLYGIAS